MIKFIVALSTLLSSLSTLSAQSLGDIADSVNVANALSKTVASQSEGQNTGGSSVSKELSLAEIDSIKIKAEQGDSVSQLVLGSFYAKGESGFPKDSEKAIEWLEKSAMQKNPSALSYLGYLYADGQLVKRDMQKAIQYRELAAENGDASVKWTLGSAYLYGFLVPKNQMKALHWITRAAEDGYVEAIKKLIEIYTNLEKTDELNKWNARLGKVRLKEAEAGDTAAMFDVAEKYMSGSDGFPRHRLKAIYWYKKSAEGGDKNAMDKVAKMYARGQFLPQNMQKALEYYEKLATMDFSYCFKISSYYAEGKNGFEKDDKKSLEWFARGAMNGDMSTKMYLVWRFWNAGELNKAIDLCKKLHSEVEKKLELMSSTSETLSKSVRAKAERNTLRILADMISKISSSEKAPKDFNSYYRSFQ